MSTATKSGRASRAATAKKSLPSAGPSSAASAATEDGPLRLVTEAATVIFLLEAALHCQGDAKLAGPVRESANVPVSMHRDKDRFLDLSSFAPMDPELFGMVQFDGVNEQTDTVSMSLRDGEGKALHHWLVPVSFFVTRNASGRPCYTRIEERRGAMMEAVRETLRRDRVRAR